MVPSNTIGELALMSEIITQLRMHPAKSAVLPSSSAAVDRTNADAP